MSHLHYATPPKQHVNAHHPAILDPPDDEQKQKNEEWTNDTQRGVALNRMIGG